MSENTPAAEESFPRRVPSGPPTLPEAGTESDLPIDPADSAQFPEADAAIDPSPLPLREGPGVGSGDADETIERQIAGITPEQAARYRRDAIAAAVVYFLFSMLLHVINLPHAVTSILPVMVGLTVLSTSAFMYFQLRLALAIVRTRSRALASIGYTLLFAALWIAVLAIHPPRTWGVHHGNLYFTIHMAQRTLMSLFLTLSLTYLGTLLSRIIREPNVLLPVAFVAMPIDYLGAMAPHGFTHDMVKNAPKVVQTMSVMVPTLHGVNVIPFIGPGDILFVAFFLMAVQNMRLNEAGTFRWMYALLTITILIVMLPMAPPIAALIPMGLAVLIANWKHFKLQRSEVFAVIYASAIVVALAAVFYAFTHHFFFKGR